MDVQDLRFRYKCETGLAAIPEHTITIDTNELGFTEIKDLEKSVAQSCKFDFDQIPYLLWLEERILSLDNSISSLIPLQRKIRM